MTFNSDEGNELAAFIISRLAASTFLVRLSGHNAAHFDAYSNQESFFINVVYIICGDIEIFYGLAVLS
jgi:hypothetical protein